VRRIFPSFPASSPRITRTVSPFRTGIDTRSAFTAWRFLFFGFARLVAR
jgi:hypothetical protein